MLKLTTITKGALFSVIISLLFTLFFYHTTVLSPNKYLFSNNGDGLKTYFNFAWHGVHDKSADELNAMSYPYGEFLLFEDSLPFISTLNMVLLKIFPGLGNYSVGIINMLILLSFPMGVLFMYLILIRFSLPYYLSALSANAIIFLSSQTLLLNPAGHLGLAVVCFFPIGWYLILRYFESDRTIKWSILIALNILIWSFTHVYLGFILLFFIALVHFFKIIFDKNISLNKSTILHITIQIIVPVVLIFSLYTLLDNHPNRIDMPFTAGYSASFHSVFLSLLSPFKPIYNLLFNVTVLQNQSWGKIGNYIGLASNIAIVSFVIIAVYLLAKKRSNEITNFLPNQIYIYVFASVILLFYSMAIPVKHLPDSIIETVPLLKQFSALGRFAWGFYYVITVFAFVFFYRWFYSYKWGKIGFYIVIVIFFIEAIPYHQRVSNDIKIHKNAFNTKHIPIADKILMDIDKDRFQAILPLPYYFKFNIPFSSSSSDSSIYASMIASYHTGLPILSTYLSRPSVSEAMSIYKMFMPPPYQKKSPEIIENGKDIVVVVHNSDTARLQPEDKLIIQKSEPYLISSNYSIYSLSIQSLFKSDINNKLDEFNKNKGSLFQKESCFINDTSSFILYDNFDTINSNIIYKGNGALMGKKLEYTHICRFPSVKLDTLVEYEVSFWYYNYIWDQTFNTAIITEIDSMGKTLQYLYYSPINSTIIDGWWYLSTHTFKPISNSSNIIVMFHGVNKFKDWFVVDELLVRPLLKDVYRIDTNTTEHIIYCNNRRIN